MVLLPVFKNLTLKERKSTKYHHLVLLVILTARFMHAPDGPVYSFCFPSLYKFCDLRGLWDGGPFDLLMKHYMLSKILSH